MTHPLSRQMLDALFALFRLYAESALTFVKAQLGYVLLFDVLSLRDPQLCYLPIHDRKQMLPFDIYYRADDGHPLLRERD